MFAFVVDYLTPVVHVSDLEPKERAPGTDRREAVGCLMT
jgi:hypothetical protein